MSGKPARRAVLDTNVLLNLWLFDDPSVRPLRAAIEAGSLRVLRSRDCDDEFEEVLAREGFGLDDASRAEMLTRWARCSEPIADVAPAPFSCTDPDDQKFLDAAFTVRADWLLTRDKALLRLARRAVATGLRITRPSAAMTYDRAHS